MLSIIYIETALILLLACVNVRQYRQAEKLERRLWLAARRPRPLQVTVENRWEEGHEEPRKTDPCDELMADPEFRRMIDEGFEFTRREA